MQRRRSSGPRARFAALVLTTGVLHVALQATLPGAIAPQALAEYPGHDAWPPVGPVLNELRVDQPGTDNDEFVEILVPPGSSLDGVSLVVLGDGAGLSGCIDEVIALSGVAVPSDGVVLVAQPQMSLGTPDLVLPLEFENSDNLTFLLVAGFVGQLGQDLDPDDDGVLELAPWTEVLDAVALVENIEAPPQGTEWWYALPVGPGANGEPPACAARCPEDGAWRVGPDDPAWGGDSPGAVNLRCGRLAACPADLDGDGVVDRGDLAILLLGWDGTEPAPHADLDGDGAIDAGDLGGLLASWGPCG